MQLESNCVYSYTAGVIPRPPGTGGNVTTRIALYDPTLLDQRPMELGSGSG